MQQATFTRPAIQRRAQNSGDGVHLRKSLFLVPVVLFAGLAGAGYWYLTTSRTTAPTGVNAADTGAWPAWLQQTAKYEPEKPPVAPPTPPAGPDANAERDRLLMQELLKLRAEMEAMKRQPATVKSEAPRPAGAQSKRAPMLFVSREPQGKEPAATAEPTYLLAPGDTKIPCTVETAMNSEVPNVFTAKTNTSVYDSKTRLHVLIPQNSTILGRYDSGDLLYGNQRIPTVSLTLALPDGSSVDLGDAPITDQQGIAGLSGRVHNHFWRNLSAVLIMSVLRGGAQAVQTGIAGGGAAGHIGSSIAQGGAQFGQTMYGRAIDTRPTIEVDAGQLCTIILTKPLHLKAWAL